jgi:outer membrane protein OmpA-like peptidoglycan-associated protein
LITRKCPAQAEDKDGFEDADGCPDLDNDTDGIPDAKDKCPGEPETKNGIDDDDGCPDVVPPAYDAAFEAATAVRFERGKPRMTKAGKAALQKALGVLRDHPMLKVTVTGHDNDADLAKKRAEAVKWYLVDQGVAQDQIETIAGPDADKPIEITLR